MRPLNPRFEFSYAKTESIKGFCHVRRKPLQCSQQRKQDAAPSLRGQKVRYQHLAMETLGAKVKGDSGHVV